MKKTNTNSGKAIAVILILMFLGINYFRSATAVGPQEKQFAQAKLAKTAEENFDKKIGNIQNVEKLKYAYTGKWDKNDLSKNAQEGQHAFAAPENTRSAMETTSAKKATDNKKKKKVAKKTKKTSKVAKKYYKRNGFANAENVEDGFEYPTRSYYTLPTPQERTPSEDEKDKVKKLTVKEWVELITSTNSIAELVSKYKSGDGVSASLYYSVAEALLSSKEDNLKKLGFEAIQQLPSVTSLTKYANHIEDEMSAETKTIALKTLETYNNPTHLKILNSALTSPSNDVKVIASTLIRSISVTVFAPQSTSGENTTYTEAQLATFKVALTQSSSILTKALEGTLDAEVKESFTTTLTILSQLLG